MYNINSMNNKLQHSREMPKDLTFHLLENITNNFSEKHKVGSGGFGEVYKAVLPNGEEIAVKKLRPIPGLDDVQFKKEFNSLMRVQHNNIIQLVAYCYEAKHKHVKINEEYIFAKMEERALCFEYLQSGSLDKYLSDESCGFDWHTRYNIIKGTCEGLNYLHNGLKDHIYHLDLKPSNILLDKNLMPKIADFCFSRLFATESILGTLGYMPPEYIDKRQISKKYDVFSLGVIIIQIMAGPSGYSKCGEMSSPQEFIELVQSNWMKRLQETSTHSSQESNILEVKTCIEIALRCVEANPDKRPAIREIIDKLNEIETVKRSLICQGGKESFSCTKEAEEIAGLSNADNPACSNSFASQSQVASQTMDAESPITPQISEYEDAESGQGSYRRVAIDSLKEVCKLHLEYKIDSVVDKAVPRTVYPHLLAQYMKQTELVGIEEAIDDLVKILLEGNEVSKQEGKIVSIVGLAGLGKTSLANALYGKLRAQFDCCAFVSVAQNLDIKKLFKCMLYQLGKKHSASVHEEIWDERLLIYELIELLQKKRYLIIIDGIWDISVWQIIRCALPDNRCGYRIITTTREIDIAKQIGVAYKLKPLGPEDSEVLFYRRMFGNKDIYSPDEQLAEVSDKILMSCAGIPLAIIVIAGLLASKGRNKMEWFNVYYSIVTGLKNNTDVNIMELILSLSYTDLPSHLKNCLSYLSVFPEDYDIEKDRLIWLWIAEGFIQCKKQESLFELGESYFYELIKRSMIQPVYKRWYYDITEYCRVHDTVLDLCYLSSNAKYVTILNYMHLTLPSKEVRWLSFQNSMVSHATHRATVSMQQVTSIVVFPSAINLMPSLLSFRVLRVLDLQSCHLSQGCSLQYLGNLIDLRYLGLRDTGITQLTEEIGNLQSLQTLDVTSNEISSLPPTVVQLRHLMCLRIDNWTRVPNRIGSLTSLEELSTLCIDDSTDIIEELGQLTELRVMGIDCHTTWNVDSLEKSLVECLHKLQKVQTLSLSVFGEYKLEAWVPPQHIRRLELKGCLSSPLRTWINPPLLLDLSFLSVEMRKLRQEDLEILGGLRALIYLDLEVDHQSIGTVQRLVVGDCSFPCLVQCMLRGYIGPVVFQQGAMPRLARLHLTFSVREMRETADVNGGFDLGLVNLPSLQDVSFLVRRGGAIKADVEEAEAALRHAIEIHLNHPVLEIYADDAEDEWSAREKISSYC